MLIAKYGTGGRMVRVMRLDSGYWTQSSNWVIGSLWFKGRILVQPNDGLYFHNSIVTGTPPDNYVRYLTHGQNLTRWWDQSNSTAYPTPITFDKDWHEYTFYDSPPGTVHYDKIDGATVRSGGVANDMAQHASYSYSKGIFTNGGIVAEIRQMQIKDLAGATKYDWDFENGDALPGGWANAVIRKASYR